MDVRFFFVRDAQQEGKIDVVYIETELQLADILTKALPTPRFKMLRQNPGRSRAQYSECLI
jgi:hypothetical protein